MSDYSPSIEKLVESFEKLPSIVSEVDKSAPDSVLFVYPVIVYFDDCFDVEGPNYLLNKEFQRLR